MPRMSKRPMANPRRPTPPWARNHRSRGTGRLSSSSLGRCAPRRTTVRGRQCCGGHRGRGEEQFGPRDVLNAPGPASERLQHLGHLRMRTICPTTPTRLPTTAPRTTMVISHPRRRDERSARSATECSEPVAGPRRAGGIPAPRSRSGLQPVCRGGQRGGDREGHCQHPEAVHPKGRRMSVIQPKGLSQCSQGAGAVSATIRTRKVTAKTCCPASGQSDPRLVEANCAATPVRAVEVECGGPPSPLPAPTSQWPGSPPRSARSQPGC